MEIGKTIDDNMGTIQEMVESMKAVKGNQFARVALHVFEIMQVLEIASVLAGCDPDDEDYIKGMLESIARITGSMISKLMRGMSNGEIDEALKMGEALMKRKEYLQDQLSNEQ